MSFLFPVSCSATRFIPRCGGPLLRPQFISYNQCASQPFLVRFRSSSARQPPSKPAKAAKSVKAIKATPLDNRPVRRRSSQNVDLAGKAPLLVKSSSQANKSPSLATEPVQKTANPPQPAAFGPPTPRQFVKGANSSDIKDTEGEKILTIDAKEEAIQRNIAIRRTKVLWPGIWTIFALLGTYGTLAYLDVKAGVPSSDGSQLSERTQLPQTWYLTPSIVLEAFKGAWNDLDKLTVGIFVASFAIHLLRRSPLPIWEKFIHVTGEKKYTAFTYPFVNANWTHLWLNMAALIWVMPSVVRYFDGDLYHTSALLISVPLITSYLSHFAYRFNLASGLMLNLGASGAIAAAFGVYFVGYADEKMWAPPGILLRLDAKYWGIFFAATQLRGAFKGASGGNRPAYMVHLVSLMLGAAYAYFDLKHHLWIPLVSEISGNQKSKTQDDV